MMRLRLEFPILGNQRVSSPSGVAETQDFPERLDLRSHDVAEDRRRELLRLFPEVRTEGGKVDFERLKTVLGETVDIGKERYGMTWPGKADAIRAVQRPSLATLRPVRDESIDFDETENVIIEGDNLEVLKLLQKSYLGKVKMIYIDPPYNTGNDFIYPDDYSDSISAYKQYTGQADEAGRDFSTNKESAGRFHSKWLSMMYPRLYLARNLLRSDGLLFVSIDDNEVANLRRLCDEIFGEENFVESFVWKKTYGGGAKEHFVVRQHEYCLLYARDLHGLADFWLSPDPEAEAKYYDGRDEHIATRGPYRLKPLEATKSMDDRANLRYALPAPDGTEIWPRRQWWWKRERAMQALANNGLVFNRTESGWSVSYKQYLRDEEGTQRGAKPFSVIDKVYTQHGTAGLRALFEDEVVLQFPKPVELVRHFLEFGTSPDSLVLDFFAGSGTTGQAVLELNQSDLGRRRFILVQLPQTTGRDDYATITDICIHRVKTAAERLREADAGRLALDGGSPDYGFRVFKLDDSNFTPWHGRSTSSESLSDQLTLHVINRREGRSRDDLLYEILIKSGFPLATPIEERVVDGRKVAIAGGGAFVLSFADQLTLDFIREIAELKPSRVVLLDEGFGGSDQLKANASQIFKGKGVTSFKTV